MQSLLKATPNYHGILDQVSCVTKAKYDNNVIDHIGLVYAEIEIELSRPIWLGVGYDEN